MGFSVTFAAIPRTYCDAFLAAAAVTVTDRPDPDGRGLISAAEHGDHFLIWRNLRVAPIFKEPDWLALSDATSLTVLDVVDSAGAQALRGFGAGRQLWEVSFQDTNDDLLAVTGSPPFDIDAMRERLRDEHLARFPDDAGEDETSLFAAYGMAIPSVLFEDMTGLYYEDGPPEGLLELSGDLPLVKLTWTGERKDMANKPWWRLW